MNAVLEEVNASEEASDSEVVRYEKAYRNTRRTQDECIETLMILEALETDSLMRDQIALKRLELESKRADMVRANIAFHTGQTTMRPPSRNLIAEISDITKQAVELNVQRATATAVLRLAIRGLKKFAEIQDISAT